MKSPAKVVAAWRQLKLFLPVITLLLFQGAGHASNTPRTPSVGPSTEAKAPPAASERVIGLSGQSTKPPALTPEDAQKPKAPPSTEPRTALDEVEETLSSDPEALSSDNLHPEFDPGTRELAHRSQLEIARQQRRTRQFRESKATLSALLHRPDCPESIKRSALLELALGAQDENDLARAQQIFSQYLSRWPQDLDVPEILLRQGLLYRKMGAPRLAVTKFYAVLTAALVLKNDRFDRYQRLVLQAQTEIGETYYQEGNFADASESFKRILKLDNKALNRPALQFKLLRSLAKLERDQEVIALSTEFLNTSQNAPETPEVRFILASAYKRTGANSESLRQVMALLQSQRDDTNTPPTVLSHWQQRTGNEIANQLYREGDFLKALDIYLALADLDNSAAWQLPVWYQIGLTLERLDQPEKAQTYYARILGRENDLGSESAPSLKNILDMARWRNSFLDWNARTEAAARDLKQANNTATGAARTSERN